MRRNILKFSFVLLAFCLAAGASGTIKKTFAAAPAPAFTLNLPGDTLQIDSQTLASWKQPTNSQTVSYSFRPITDFGDFVKAGVSGTTEPSSQAYISDFNVPAIYKYLTQQEPSINRQAAEPAYKEDNGTVTEFNPGEEGRALDINESINNIIAALTAEQTQASLAVETTEPLKKLADLNSRGISELLASGVSDFSGSPKNRIYNIQVGVKKETGTLIAPGQEFSFNQYLGPVDGEHGFLPELVIKSNVTAPEFGGGLCQVSSTVFRAAVNAGLPITARRNHSYAVRYYAPQGTDATIYPGSQDLKFVNNTPGYILVWTSFPAKNKLEFDFYGTKDNRKVALDGPYSFDRQPDGSLKAVWYRSTTMPDGSVIKDAFKSNYVSPSLFPHETTAAAPAQKTTPAAPSPNATGTPATPQQNDPLLHS